MTADDITNDLRCLQHRRRRMLLRLYAMYAVAVLLVGLAGYCGSVRFERWWNPPPKVIARSESPDGRYVCTVIEHAPGGFRGSPYTYDFALVDKQTGKTVSRRDDMYMDSCTLGQIAIEWKEGSVEVTHHYEASPSGSILFSPSFGTSSADSVATE